MGCGEFTDSQLFDDRAQSIYCAVSIWKEAGLVQLRARMKCQTFGFLGGNLWRIHAFRQPPAPYTLHSVLASNYLKNWRRMCINCVPSVYAPLRQNGNNFGSGTWNQRNNNNAFWNNENNNANWDWGNNQNNVNIGNQNYDGFGNGSGSPRRGILRVRTDQKYWRIYQISQQEGRQIASFIVNECLIFPPIVVSLFQNRIRANIASGIAPNLPVAAGMNQIVSILHKTN